jgi:hypothetical protein
VKGTNTIAFIQAAEVPRDRTVTYGRFLCDIRQQKAEQHRVRLTVDGDHIDYPGETMTNNMDLTTSKYLWNSIISMKDAGYICVDVKNFYLNTLLDRPIYMPLALSITPQEIIDKYKLLDEVKNGQLYIQIDKDVYGLPHAGRLAKVGI